MAIKVGNSWVSEAAYAQAKSNIAKEQETVLDSSAKDSLSSLQSKYGGLNISTNTAPYGGTGINNIGVHPNVLREMADNPEKRLEYEALMIDCQDASKSLETAFRQSGLKLKSHGFIIDGKGSLTSWSVVESADSNKTSKFSTLLPKDDKKSWIDLMLKKSDKTDASKRDSLSGNADAVNISISKEAVDRYNQNKNKY